MKKLSNKEILGLLQEIAIIVDNIEYISKLEKKPIQKNDKIYSWASIQTLFANTPQYLQQIKNQVSRIDSAKVSFGAKRLMRFMFNDFNERLGKLFDNYEESFNKLSEEFKNKPTEKYKDELKTDLFIQIADLISKTFSEDYNSLQKLGANTLVVMDKKLLATITVEDPPGAFPIFGECLANLADAPFDQKKIKTQLNEKFINLMFDCYNFGILKACKLNSISMCLVKNAYGIGCVFCDSVPPRFAGHSQNILDDNIYPVEDLLNNFQVFHHGSCNFVINPIL